MALDTNIALGIRPLEQPNMLAQMGQMMQIRQMQQGYESENALRDFYAQGGDLSTAEGKRQLMSRAPAAGMKLIGQQSEISARDIGAAEKSLAMMKNQAGFIRTSQDAANWLKSFYANPLTRPYVEAVAPMDQALAAIPNDPAGLETWLKRASLRSDQIFTSADADLRAKVDREGQGVTMRGQNMTDARVREQLEFEKNRRSVIPGDNRYNTTDPYGNIYPVEGYGAVRGPNAPAAAPVGGGGSANAFVTARPSVNAFAPTAVQPNAVIQPGSPTVANAAAIQQQANIPRPPPRPEVAPTLTRVDDPANPGRMLEIDARTYKGGTIGDPGVLGVARTNKLTPAQELKLKTEMSKEFENVQRVVGQTNELLESIDAVRSSNLERVTGQLDARTPSFTNQAQIAETRFNNLKGKVTAIAKANASLGGAIGSIANQEWQILANQIAVLERTGGKDANLEQIEQLERQALGIVNRMRDGFERRFGENLDDLAPQYKDLPNVNYTPGQYTATGKKSSGVDNNNPLLRTN